MALLSIPATALLLIVAFSVFEYIIKPAYFSPLAKVPNAHWSAPITRLWILSKRSVEQETPAVHEAHLRLGPFVRIAPNEISVNSVDGGIRTIYAGGFEKGDWYENIFCNYGKSPMFAMPAHGPHSRRKRMLSNIYAKSTLQASPAMRSITNTLLNERLIPELKQLSSSEQPADWYFIFCAATMDFVSAYIFGLQNSSNYMQQPAMGQKFFRDYKARQRHQFWMQDLPRFTTFMRSAGLLSLIIPPWVATANRDIEAWLLSMCDSAENTVRKAAADGDKCNAQDWPTVYAQLRNALLKENLANGKDLTVEKMVEQERLHVASEMLDHTLAGFDTSSITLTFLAWELSLPENLQWQNKLREELKGLKDNWDAKEIDSFPVLHAILMETLRLHAAIPGNQPRITPPSTSLGAAESSIEDLPANIRVQSQAWSLHRNPDVFPDPESWIPSRWLDSSEAQLKEMQRWFWAFGSGGRMCVGSNLAMLDMKAIIAGIWSRFTTSVVDGSGMVHNGGYVAEPKGKNGQYLLMNIEQNTT